MSTLDSRALTYLDCFGRQFAEPGRVRYGVGGPVAAFLKQRQDLPFSIRVATADQGADPTQHDVAVDFVDGRFTVEPDDLRITAGDVVLWHTSSPTAPPYGVWGEGDGGRFSSGELRAGSFYSHAFVEPGDASWADARSRRSLGVVHVKDVDRDDPGLAEEWTRSLEQGTVVVIDGDRVEPAELEILAGQTVFFAVGSDPAAGGGDGRGDAGGGISVTDLSVTDLAEQSLARSRGPR